jgi:DNA-binding transcriptional LysR family regulator
MRHSRKISIPLDDHTHFYSWAIVLRYLLKGKQKGRLRIAAPFTTLYSVFPVALKNYIKQFPNIELTILDKSQQGVLDLIILNDHGSQE